MNEPLIIFVLAIAAYVGLKKLAVRHYRDKERFMPFFINCDSKEQFADNHRSVRRVMVNKKKATDPEWIDFGKQDGHYFAEWCRRDEDHYTWQRVIHVRLENVGLMWPSFEELEQLIFKDYILHQKAMDAGLWTPNFDLMCEIGQFIGIPQVAYDSFPQWASLAEWTVKGIEESGRIPKAWNRFATRKELEEAI